MDDELRKTAKQAGQAVRVAAETSALAARPGSPVGQEIAARMQAIELGVRARAVELDEERPR